jgi:hypothetical protein
MNLTSWRRRHTGAGKDERLHAFPLFPRLMKPKITSISDILTALEYARVRSAKVAIAVCLADQITTFTLGDGRVILVSPERLRIEGSSSLIETTIDGAAILPSETATWGTLDEARKSLQQAPLLAEILLPSGNVVLIGFRLLPRAR